MAQHDAESGLAGAAGIEGGHPFGQHPKGWACRMEQQGLTLRDLEPFIGSSGRVSEVLNRKRRLSLRMVKRLHDGLNIPYESLMAGV
jgi:hypothetical protein